MFGRLLVVVAVAARAAARGGEVSAGGACPTTSDLGGICPHASVSTGNCLVCMQQHFSSACTAEQIDTYCGGCLQPPCENDEPAFEKQYGAGLLTNPLKGLPALPKYHHQSGEYNFNIYNSSYADNVIFDITRITGAAPLELGYANNAGHGGNPSGDAKNYLKVLGAVTACAKVSALGGRKAVISMNWDPWMWRYKKRDPIPTAGEKEELDFMANQSALYNDMIARANKAIGAHVRVGAVVIDSEQFIWPGYPDAIPTPQYWDAVARKNKLIWDATRTLYPMVNKSSIVWYSRGGVFWKPYLNQSQCDNGRAALQSGVLPAGYCMGTDVAIDPSFDKSSPFAVSLYALGEPERTRQDFVHTAAAARKFNVNDGAVWPYLALGVGHHRCLKSMPLYPGQVPPAPHCPQSEYVEPNSGLYDYGWTYDFSYSALIGAMINQKQYEHSPYGPWEQATGVVFYPPVADDRGLPSKIFKGSTSIMDHFVAYVRGAAGIA
jgi:hypothetical protein